jgi:pimeloyl-ACP methyl ester carboxylesterase
MPAYADLPPARDPGVPVLSTAALSFLESAAPPSPSRGAGVLVAGAVALAAAAVYVKLRTRRADRDSALEGRFITVEGLRLHYLERGNGPLLVVFPGNGSLVDEWVLSGFVDLAARHFRVVVFDRPGFGFSDRPADREWNAEEQAALFAAALRELQLDDAIVLGHSWGTLVALALALDHPERVRGVVLLSGYYFPTVRPDAFLLSAPAWPVVGPLMAHTTSPLLARLLWPALERVVFGPPPTPPAFEEIDKWRFLKPSRLRSAARESGMLPREAGRAAARYHALACPVAILAGSADRLVSLRRHARRLHVAIPDSTLDVLPGMGHMLHHDVPLRVLAAMQAVARRAGDVSEREAGAAEQAELSPSDREAVDKALWAS